MIPPHVIQAMVKAQVVHWAVDGGSLCKKLSGNPVTWGEQGQGNVHKWAPHWDWVDCPDCLAIGKPTADALPEGKVKKGGQNEPPTTSRPSPPAGQEFVHPPATDLADLEKAAIEVVRQLNDQSMERTGATGTTFHTDGDDMMSITSSGFGGTLWASFGGEEADGPQIPDVAAIKAHVLEQMREQLEELQTAFGETK